jgi:hypothetical protein
VSTILQIAHPAHIHWSDAYSPHRRSTPNSSVHSTEDNSMSSIAWVIVTGLIATAGMAVFGVIALAVCILEADT